MFSRDGRDLGKACCTFDVDPIPQGFDKAWVEIDFRQFVGQILASETSDIRFERGHRGLQIGGLVENVFLMVSLTACA